MRRLVIPLVLLMVLCTLPLAMADDDHDKSHRLRTRLSGYNEVHFFSGNFTVTPIELPALRGAISTEARGRFKATINKDEIEYELSYRDLEGTVSQAHIHFGQKHTVGGIVVWLCQTGDPGNAPEAVRALTPFCPEEGTVKGTITPAQILSQAAQGFDEGNFDELVRAIRAGATYVNVHSSLFGPGEIRGQLKDDDDE